MAMVVVLFFLGALLGLIAGQAVCIKYMRREMLANVGPRLRQMQAQLDSVQAALDRLQAAFDLAVMSRYADLSRLRQDLAS